MVNTLYTQLEDRFFVSLRNIKLLACDVDGVFSDGRIYLGNDGEELKAFHTRDGYGVKALLNIGVQVAVITGRRSVIVQSRMRNLGVTHIIQGSEDKASALAKLQSELGLSAADTASIGDDMPDLGMYAHSSVNICVADGHPSVKSNAHWITQLPGGFGAVREVADTLLQAHNKLDQCYGASV